MSAASYSGALIIVFYLYCIIGKPGNLLMYNEDGVGLGKCEEGGGHFNYKIEVGGHLVWGGNCSRPGSHEDKRKEEGLVDNDAACGSVHSAVMNLLVQHFKVQG